MKQKCCFIQVLDVSWRHADSYWKVYSIPDHASNLHSLPPALWIMQLDHCPDPYAAGAATTSVIYHYRTAHVQKLGGSTMTVTYLVYTYTHLEYSTVNSSYSLVAHGHAGSKWVLKKPLHPLYKLSQPPSEVRLSKGWGFVLRPVSML